MEKQSITYERNDCKITRNGEEITLRRLMDTVAIDVAMALDEWLKVKNEIYGSKLETGTSQDWVQEVIWFQQNGG